MATMQPRCRSAAGLQQLRYQVPYTITSSVVYPLSSSNGSSIIVNGHSTGLCIVWRGGRQLKPAKSNTLSNPTPVQDVMTIDDSDDDQPASETLTPADFEDEEEEFDPRNPYPSIVQTLDLPLETGVLHLAIPPLSEAERRHLKPRFLRDKILLVIGCADASVRVLTIPLTPPSEPSKARKSLLENPILATAGNGSWGEQMVEVPNGLGHRTLPTSVSIAVTPRYLVVDNEDEEMGDTDGRQDEWDVLVTSGSADAGGTLLVHRIPVEEDGSKLVNNGLELWRSVLLDTFPTSLDLYAGPDVTSTSYPKVIVAQANRSVRIYECSSEETRDEGKWTVSLQPNSKSETSVANVRFGLAGRLALALAKNGEWGVWDVSNLTDHVEAESNSTITKFAYGGTLAPSSLASASQTRSRQTDFKSLPAVTPHTHKVRQQALFGGGNHSTPTSSTTSSTSQRGGISLTKTTHKSGSGEDSSLLIWHSDRAIFIQSLQAHNASHSKTFGSDSSSALVSVDDPFNSTSSTGSQIKNLTVPDRATLSGGAQIVVIPLLKPAGRGPSVRSKAPEVVYVSERAISFVGPPLVGDAEVKAPVSAINEEPRQTSSVGFSGLLKRGELSLEGVEGMLDRMAGSVKRLSGRA